MSETANSEGASEHEKPVANDDVQFPPFLDPKDDDFDDDIVEEEREYYKTKFKDLNIIKKMRLHCTACDRHIGCSARNEQRMRAHPMLRTLVCHNCHVFYNSGEFEKGDDGSELYCRWCGQGGQVYCCSDCPHVFCAKCIKRNLGTPKIKEIENADDWKCFKCNSACLKDLRALCWAVLRYCDLKNKITHQTEDPELKERYKKDCAIDYSECCKNKISRRNQKIESAKKKDIKKEPDVKSSTANIISKISSTIQVKKFASINLDENSKQEKKAQKRPLSPKLNKPVMIKNPIALPTPVNIAPKIINPVPPLAKKIRLPNMPMRIMNMNDKVQMKPMATYSRVRSKGPQLPISISNSFNGFNSSLYGNLPSDNINLSLESLTQGLDMAAVAAISQNSQDDDVVCTPDFPLEPLCEVTEDNDDDVECITPGPVAAPKIVNPPPLVARGTTSMTPDIAHDNIIQMTENDVTVNAATGGLKFRVDPQTLSSNKMYRLPDGRIFAINANPNMPGGYSATIVAVTEPTGKATSKGATYAAKLSAVSTSTPNTSASKSKRKPPSILKRNTPKTAKVSRSTETSSRECDLHVPVEWYRYNLIDAVDALEYSLSRLHKLKKEATTVYLRTRTVNEMRNLHKTLDRLLSTSSSRFGEIRDNLNKGLKQYISKKGSNISDDDDDVEILPNDDNDDPIFIDENSVDSVMNGSDHQEVDLTGAASSEYNDSGDNTKDHTNKDSDISNNYNDNLLNYITPVISNIKTCMDVTQNVDSNEKDQNDCMTSEIHTDSVQLNETENSTNETEAEGKEKEIDDTVEGNDSNNSVKELEDTTSEVISAGNTNIEKDEPIDTSNDKDLVNEDQDMECKDMIDNNKENTQNKEIKIEDTEVIDSEGAKYNTKEGESEEEFKKSNTKGVNGETEKSETVVDKFLNSEDCKPEMDLNDKGDSQDIDDKLQEPEMSDELIETLLKDDNVVGDETNSNAMDVSEVLQET